MQKVGPFCHRLREAVTAAGLEPEGALAVFRTAISAECVGCGIRLSGEELFALSEAPSAERASAKIGRVRLGYCARQGCNCCYYNFSFQRHPRIDWPKVLVKVDELPAGQKPKACAALSARQILHLMRRVCVVHQVWLVFALILLLLLVRQWYFGGSIPLLRQPEHFRVDPLPEETSPH